MVNKKWLDILSQTNIDPKYYDKVCTYIDTHELIEYKSVVDGGDFKTSSTISIALDVISRLDNLERVEFITSPVYEVNEKHYTTETLVVTTPIEVDNIDTKNVSVDFIISLEEKNVEQLAVYLNDLLKNSDLYIYSIFNEMKILINNEDCTINLHSRHRFFKIDNNDDN